MAGRWWLSTRAAAHAAARGGVRKQRLSQLLCLGSATWTAQIGCTQSLVTDLQRVIGAVGGVDKLHHRLYTLGDRRCPTLGSATSAAGLVAEALRRPAAPDQPANILSDHEGTKVRGEVEFSHVLLHLPAAAISCCALVKAACASW
jgi:hypothetical protein